MRIPETPEEAREMHDEAHGASCACVWVQAQKRYGQPGHEERYKDLLERFMQIKGRSGDEGVTAREALEFFKQQAAEEREDTE